MENQKLQEKFKSTYQKFFAEHKIIISLPTIIENIWANENRGVSFFSITNSRIYLAESNNKSKKRIKYYDYQKDKRIKKDQYNKYWSINILSEIDPKLIKNFESIIEEGNAFLEKKIETNNNIKWETYLQNISYSTTNWKDSIVFNTWYEKLHRAYDQIRKNKIQKEQNIRICYIPEETNKTKKIKQKNKTHKWIKEQKYTNEFLRKLLPRQRPQRENKNTEANYQDIEAKRFIDIYNKRDNDSIDKINQISLKKISEIKKKETRRKLLKIHQILTKKRIIFIWWNKNYFKIININANEEDIEKNLYAEWVVFTKNKINWINNWIKIEQNIKKRIINDLIPKNSFILDSHNKDCKIGNYEELCKNRKNDIIIDPVYNKIFIFWEKVKSNEIHSQTMTVEILSHLLKNINQNIPNTRLSPSSYSKNKNDMFSKIISPLKKITKQKVGKEIPLTCSWSLHDFNIKLNSSKIKFWIIREFN